MFTVFERRVRWPDARGDVFFVRTLLLFGVIPLMSRWEQLTTKDPLPKERT